MATTVAGVADGERQVVKANQRDRMREMLDRNGVLPPEPEPEGPAPVKADLGEIAADEQDQMEGYHGLTTDDASGMKMFCASSLCVQLPSTKFAWLLICFTCPHRYGQHAERAQTARKTAPVSHCAILCRAGAPWADDWRGR